MGVQRKKGEGGTQSRRPYDDCPVLSFPVLILHWYEACWITVINGKMMVKTMIHNHARCCTAV